MAWFAFHIEAYDADTMHLSVAEDGVYGRLLRFYYKTRTPLPNDDKALAAIARITVAQWKPMAKTIRAFFSVRRGHLVHKRCDEELNKQDNYSKRRSEHATRASHSRASYINKIRSPRHPADAPEIISETSHGDLKRSTRPDKIRQNPLSPPLAEISPRSQRNGHAKHIGPATGIAKGFADAIAQRDADRGTNHSDGEPLLDDGRRSGAKTAPST